MQYAYDSDGVILFHAINGDVWSSLNDQFACAFKLAWSSQSGKAHQLIGLFADASIHKKSILRTVLHYIIEDAL